MPHRARGGVDDSSLAFIGMLSPCSPAALYGLNTFPLFLSQELIASFLADPVHKAMDECAKLR